jgi:predicted nucleic-acid-binding Zn-ribbon protein
MSEYKQCPKCGIVMEEQKGIGFVEPVLLYGKRKSKGMILAPFLCPRCGYIELYKSTHSSHTTKKKTQHKTTIQKQVELSKSKNQKPEIASTISYYGASAREQRAYQERNARK